MPGGGTDEVIGRAIVVESVEQGLITLVQFW